MESIAGNPRFLRVSRYLGSVIIVLLGIGISACATTKETACVIAFGMLGCQAIYGSSNDAEKREAEARKARLQKKVRIAQLESQANEGDAEAIIELAELTGNMKPVRSLAQSGNLPAAYALYEQLWKKEETSRIAWLWLCKSANGRYPRAQLKVAYWHQEATWNIEPPTIRSRLRDIGVRPNDITAYMWFEIAAASGATPAQLAHKSWGAYALTTAEISQAEQMARDWNPGDCPSAEHRLAPPGET